MALDMPNQRSGGGVLRTLFVLLFLLVLLVAICVVHQIAGGEIDPDLSKVTIELIREVRWDRLLAGLAVGVGLSVSGVFLQAMLRNPLASPYLLGISGGAAVGVAMSRAGLFVALNVWLMEQGVGALSQSGAAFNGAWGALATVYVLSQKRGWVDPLGMVLVGVVVTSIAAAAIMLIHYFYPITDVFGWMMGFLNEDDLRVVVFTHTVEGEDWRSAWGLIPAGEYRLAMIQLVLGVVGMGVLCGVLLGRSMDVATLSDAEASAIGVHTGRLRLTLFLLAGMMTSVTVVVAGPIGFVGLIGPHMARLMMGPRHRGLVLGAALMGGILVVGADSLVQWARENVEGVETLPLGAIMSVVGGPIFVLLLRGHLGRGGEG